MPVARYKRTGARMKIDLGLSFFYDIYINIHPSLKIKKNVIEKFPQEHAKAYHRRVHVLLDYKVRFCIHKLNFSTTGILQKRSSAHCNENRPN